MAPASWPTLLSDETWRDRPIAEHARGLESACRAAMHLLDSLPDREARLRTIDPVPDSTRALLRRLAARGHG